MLRGNRSHVGWLEKKSTLDHLLIYYRCNFLIEQLSIPTSTQQVALENKASVGKQSLQESSRSERGSVTGYSRIGQAAMEQTLTGSICVAALLAQGS